MGISRFFVVTGALIVWIAFPGKDAHAKASSSCAKASVRGNSCKSLKINFDLSRCKADPSPPSDPMISCHEKQATVKVLTEKFSYQARLELVDRDWGEPKWKLVEKVTQYPIEKNNVKTPASSISTSSSQEAKVTQLKEESQKQQEPVPAQPSTTPQTPSSSGITFSGLFDTYYVYNGNRPPTPNSISSTSVTSASIPNGNNNLRYYDIYHNQLALNLAELTFKKTSPEISFLADLDFGGFADQNAAAVSPSTSSSSQVVDEVSKNIGQAFLTFTPSWAPGLTIDIGKMPTHVGYELMKPRDNWQYSRSTVFGFGGPFWHTGIHVGYAVIPNKFIPSVYLYNGWNTIYDNNSGKTLGAQLKFVPFETLTLIYNFIGGPEQATNNSNKKTIHEANVVFSPTSKLSFALELLTGREENVLVGTETVSPSWRGMTLHAKHQILSWYYLSPRFEIYRDTHGYTVGGPSQTIHGYTLTNSLTLTDGFETRVEFRYDHSTYGQRFTTHDGTAKAQFTSTFAFIYSL